MKYSNYPRIEEDILLKNGSNLHDAVADVRVTRRRWLLLDVGSVGLSVLDVGGGGLGGDTGPKASSRHTANGIDRICGGSRWV